MLNVKRLDLNICITDDLVAPQPIDAWTTYNFEVEDLHTYVAGGVQNTCVSVAVNGAVAQNAVAA